MIPISLVSGFLGSGKSTFLARTIERCRGRKIVYLVNEFSPVDVDGRVLAAAGGEVVVVAGGSIFCRCLVAEFIGRLKAIDGQFNTPNAPLEGVVVEASGIADPKVIGPLLAETKLERTYKLGRIVTVVEPGTFGTLRHTLPNIIAQVEAADAVLINKIDLYSAAEVSATERLLREINPSATIIQTQYCRADIALFAAGGGPAQGGQYALCRDPHYAVINIKLERPVDLPRLTAALAAIQRDVYRVKGFVLGGNGPIYLDVTPTELRISPILTAPPDSDLVFIVPADRREQIAAFAAKLHSADFVA